MSHIKITVAAIMLLAASAPALSTPLTPEEALSAALASGARRLAPASGVSDASAYTLKWTGPHAGIYVFERKDGGFVMAAGDDSNPAPLLGYSLDDPFDPDNIPPALQEALEAFARGDLRMSRTRAVRENIAPLMTTKWNQDVPFNLDCPFVGASRTYTGCGATAVAQIMKKWNHPEVGNGTGTGSTSTQTFNFNYKQHPFDWDNMVDVYKGVKVTKEQTDAVANLMYAAGMAINMRYGTEYSSCVISDVTKGLVNHLGYDRGLQLRYRDTYEIDEWNAMIYEELKAGRPLYYTGFGEGMGHAFVCDGYDGTEGDYFHFNWGWGGVADGYYLVNNLKPNQTGIGAGYGTYNNGQFVIFGVKPAENSSKFYPSFLSIGMMHPSRSSYTRNANQQIEMMFDQPTVNQQNSDFHAGGIYSLSLSNLTVNFGVKFTDIVTGEVSYSFSPQGVQTHQLGGFRAFVFPQKNIPMEGTFTVDPIVIFNMQTYDVPQEIYNRKRLILNATPDKLEFYNDDTPFTGVEEIGTVEPEGEKTVYNMSGVRVNETEPGHIYIIVDQHGRAKRILAK